MKKSNLRLRVDPELKAQAAALYESLGMDLSTATRIFYIQSLRCHGLPFKVKADDIAYGDCDVSRRFKDTHREKHDDSDYYEINNGRNGSIEFDGGGYGKLTIGVSE